MKYYWNEPKIWLHSWILDLPDLHVLILLQGSRDADGPVDVDKAMLDAQVYGT